MSDPLERPVWSALAGGQAGLGQRRGDAARFDPAIGPLCGTAAGEADALADLIGPGEILVLLEPAPVSTGRLRIEGQRECVQMVLERLPDPVPLPEGVHPLGRQDAADMLELAALTEPGPFRDGTWRLGGFIGLRDGDGRLIAMAGERLRPPGHVEVSGICTHPDARGRGLAKALTIAKLHDVVAQGLTPFLHAYADNDGAIALYERLGFMLRRSVIATRLVAKFTE